MRTHRIAWALSGLALSLSGCGEEFVATGGAGGTTQSTSSTGGAGGQVTSGGGGQGGTGGGQGGTTASCAPLKNDTCNQCLVDHCAGVYCDCAGSKECVDYLTCVAMGGPDPQAGYLELCAQKSPNSIALAGNLAVCGAKSCAVCGIKAPDACAACEYESCPTELNKCLSSPLCTGYAKCAAACADEPCITQCANEHDGGKSLYDNLVGCTKDACGDACM